MTRPPTPQAGDELDVAIVGAGAAGTYLAYRLIQARISSNGMTSLRALVCSLGVLVGCLAACGDPGAPAASDTAVASPASHESPSEATASPAGSVSASAGPNVFESTRHHYRVDVPAGWIVNEYGGSWETLSQFSPGGEIPGEDAIAASDFSSFLVMDSMPIPSEMTEGDWRSAFEAIVDAGLPTDCPGTKRSGTFAGEPATILEQTCAGASIVGRSLAHAGRGYYFTTKSPQADRAGTAIVEELATSIEFTD